MKKWLIIAVVWFLAAQGAVAQQSQDVYVKVKSENFRAAPSGKILGKLFAGTPMKKVSEKGNWVKVQIEGYIWKPSVTSDSTDVEGFKLRAWHILVKTPEEAQRILKMLKNGADFQELAVKYSIDPNAKKNRGDLGYFQKGDLLKEFEDAVLKLKPGEISGVVKTPLGYHIIKRIR